MAHPHDGTTGATFTHLHFGTSGTILIQFETGQLGSKMAQFHTESSESFLAQTQIESRGAIFAQAHFGASGAEIAQPHDGSYGPIFAPLAIAGSGIPCASAALESIACDTSNPGTRARGLQSPDTEPPWRRHQGDQKKELSCAATY
jgi:hypothetical protein